MPKGIAKIAQKVGEEGTETVIAALVGDRAELVGEAADLMFHLMVLLSAKDVPLADVLAELERREGHYRVSPRKPAGAADMAVDATLPYDDQNIFAKILRGEIPNRTVL